MRRLIIPCAIFTVILVGLFTGCQNPALSSAKLYIQQNNYDAAIEQCQIAIEQAPDNPEVYFVLGEAYAKKQMFREMNDAYDKSLELSDKRKNEIDQSRLKYWIDIFNKGVTQIKLDQLEEAAQNFETAIVIQPDKVDAYQNLAFAYAQMEQVDKAVDVYQRGLAVVPDDMEMKMTLGTLYYQSQQYDEAIELFDGILAETDPQTDEYKQALYNLAYSYDLKGDPDKAIEAYESALEISPDDKDLLFNMGRIYYVRENYEEAITQFQRVLALDEADFESHFNIGVSYLQMEKFNEAIPFLEKAVEIIPDNANAWTNLAIAYVRAGFPDKGQEAFDRADALKGTE